MHESNYCTISNYARLLIHMHKCTNLDILNGTHIFTMTNVLTCLHASRGGNVVDYVLVKEWDASRVNTFSIGPLWPDSNHKPLHLHIATKSSQFDQCIRVQKERGKLWDLAMANIIYMKKRLRIMSWTFSSIKMWKAIRRNWRMSLQGRVSIF